MQATVLRCDPATRSLVVQAVGTQIPQNVVVNPQMMMPMLREGQTVTINGTSNPQGFIEAQQVTPMGQ
jgi:cytochrome c-type biogenesis protein CcmE